MTDTSKFAILRRAARLWAVAAIHGEAGRLARSARGGPTTTAESVAEYLARKESAHSRQHRTVAGQPQPSPTSRHAYDPLPPLYKGLLRDYFLAVVLRRKMSHRSDAFHRSVFVTQCFLLAGIVALFWLAGDRAVRSRLIPPERQTVQSWLDARYEKVDLKSVEVLSREPLRVHARYIYYVNGRKIESQQEFTLDGKRVVGVGSDG